MTLADHRRCVDADSPCGEDCVVFAIEADECRVQNLIDSYNAKVADFAAETRRNSALLAAGRQMFEALHDCWLHDPANDAAQAAMRAWEAADPNEAI